MTASKKFVRLMVLTLLVVALTAVSLVSAQADKKILVTGRQMGSSDIPTIDPAVAEDVPSVQVIAELFVELVRINEETSQPENGLASWTVSDDGLVYTFSIMPEVSWVRYNADTDAIEQVVDDSGNPRYVTADDFKYGILRAIDPATAAPYAYVVAPWIKGGSEFQADTGAAEDVAIEVVDANTLKVTVNRLSTANVFAFGMWPTMAQPQWLIEEQAEFWIDPANIATYGPFALKEWVRGDGGSLTIIKNPFWAGTGNIPQPKLDEVQFKFLDEEVQLTEFEAGNMDVAELPDTEFERVTANSALNAAAFAGPGTCTYYYGFNVEKAPFDDVRVRRAFSMAIDRAAITNDVMGAGQIPTGVFTLPTLVGAPTIDAFPEIGIKSDVAGAQSLWNEYLTETGKQNSDFTLTLFHNESSLHSTIAQAVQQMWADTLGVTVNIATADFATYLNTRGNYDVYRAAWCFDYPDTHNFLYDAGFHSDLLTENDTHWSSAAYDELINAAFAAPAEERAALYAQADNILTNEEAAIAPIYYYVTNDLTQPYVERTHSFITREYYEKWDISR